MKNILIIKQIYFEVLRNLGTKFMKSCFKAFTWFFFAAYFVALCIFVFRVFRWVSFD